MRVASRIKTEMDVSLRLVDKRVDLERGKLERTIGDTGSEFIFTRTTNEAITSPLLWSNRDPR